MSAAALKPLAPTRWMSVREAAGVLAMHPDALRRALERKAVRAADGVVEAAMDGVRARKFGRLWRVSFSARWVAHDREGARHGS